MKVSIHQPQYIPWLPYFLKIDESDLFIFLDTVDFQKNGLQNRNQIKTGQGAQWLTVPVQQNFGQKIRDTAIDNRVGWRRKHQQTIQQCYGKSPGFSDYFDSLDELFSMDWDNLSVLDVELTRRMMGWLGIDTPTRLSSDLAATGSASDLVLNICLEVGATTYVSGTGGASYLRVEEFERAGINVEFRPTPAISAYPQAFPKAGFVEHLSALDILLNCGADWRRYVALG